jgi:hypothetical protein
MDNSVRVTNRTSPFTKSLYEGRSLSKSSVPLLRLVAGFSGDTTSFDPFVVYFDDKATNDFDGELDALKLFNTDAKIPNLYAVSTNGFNLSIDALPTSSATSFSVPLGLKTSKAGDIIFKVKNLSAGFSAMRMYLTDLTTGAETDLIPGNVYKVTLTASDYKNRFFINFSNITTSVPENKTSRTDPFNVYCSDGILKAEINEIQGNEGSLVITNFLGQTLFTEKIYDKGYHELNPSLKDGIYLVSYITGRMKVTKKIIFLNE